MPAGANTAAAHAAHPAVAAAASDGTQTALAAIREQSSLAASSSVNQPRPPLLLLLPPPQQQPPTGPDTTKSDSTVDEPSPPLQQVSPARGRHDIICCSRRQVTGRHADTMFLHSIVWCSLEPHVISEMIPCLLGCRRASGTTTTWCRWRQTSNMPLALAIRLAS